jgi:CheY-like chemotaxis protein
MLRRMGHEIECASSVGEALVKLEEWFPQCVLLDLMLPDASGALVLRKIRLERLPIKVAVITAVGKNSPTLRAALGYDPDIVFEKPLQHKDLIRWLVTSPAGPLALTAPEWIPRTRNFCPI